MLINVENLTKIYKSYERGNTFKEAVKSLFIRKPIYVHALKNISFSIQPGELVGFLGPNGAGKSTTLKILTGILYPTSGNVEIMGYTPWKHRKKYVAKIGAVFGQKSQLLWDIPPLDAFYLNKAIYSIPERNFKRTMNNLVELLDLKDLIRKPTRLLSLGERMKCEFVMAMLHQPEIVFLDEPTIGLDVIAQRQDQGVHSGDEPERGNFHFDHPRSGRCGTFSPPGHCGQPWRDCLRQYHRYLTEEFGG